MEDPVLSGSKYLRVVPILARAGMKRGVRRARGRLYAHLFFRLRDLLVEL